MPSSVVTVPLHCNSVGGSVFSEHATAVAVVNVTGTAKNVEREMHVTHPLDVGHLIKG